MQKHLIFHAAPEMRSHIEDGLHGFANMISQIFTTRGYGLRVAGIGRADLWRAKLDNNLHIFDMAGAQGRRALNMRPSVLQPFWAVERPNSRYQGRMAHKVFDPSTVGGGLVTPFFEEMQKLYLNPQGPDIALRDYVLVPLQGQLGKQRPWQYASARGMVETIRAQDPTRKIVLKPHPKETYSAADNVVIAQLKQLPNVQLLELPIEALIANCAYIVTQNSTAVFEGILQRKPSILFAKSDFHHIFPTVKSAAEAPEAFARVEAKNMLFMKYLYWYLRMNAADIRQANAPAKTLEMLAEAGWNMES
ncbi:MAG TPA: hypothetical protein EYG79_06210 [Rhodobacteraceae bacterium]|nr:hypothetical protein [Paracoccaceae bacterium]